MEQKHTNSLFAPLKVKRGHEGYQLHDAHGMVCDGMTGNHAQEVLMRCNAHDQLVRALEGTLGAIEGIYEDIFPETCDKHLAANGLYVAGRAALLLARGK